MGSLTCRLQQAMHAAKAIEINPKTSRRPSARKSAGYAMCRNVWTAPRNRRFLKVLFMGCFTMYSDKVCAMKTRNNSASNNWLHKRQKAKISLCVA